MPSGRPEAGAPRSVTALASGLSTHLLASADLRSCLVHQERRQPRHRGAGAPALPFQAVVDRCVWAREPPPPRHPHPGTLHTSAPSAPHRSPTPSCTHSHSPPFHPRPDPPSHPRALLTHPTSPPLTPRPRAFTAYTHRQHALPRTLHALCSRRCASARLCAAQATKVWSTSASPARATSRRRYTRSQSERTQHTRQHVHRLHPITL